VPRPLAVIDYHLQAEKLLQSARRISHDHQHPRPAERDAMVVVLRSCAQKCTAWGDERNPPVKFPKK
jgi:hypothetical protein